MATAKPKSSPSTSSRTVAAAAAKPAGKATATQASAKRAPAKRAAAKNTPAKATKPAAAKTTAAGATAAKSTKAAAATGTKTSASPATAPIAKKGAKKAATKAATKRGATGDAPATKAIVSGGLEVGDAAPPFELLGDDGKRHGLASHAGKRFVLYFYPKDDTPGCTKEACQFSELPGFEKLDVPVVGVSADSIASHQKFRAKYRLTISLLSDPGNVVALQYGAYGEKLMYGKPVVGTKRSTFLIGPNGRIEKIWRNVRADGHAAEVFAALAK